MTQSVLRAPSRPVHLDNLAQAELRAAGMRVKDLAEICGVSSKSASRWLRGEKRPDEVHARVIEQRLDVPARHWCVSPDAGSETVAARTPGSQRVSLPAAPHVRPLPPPERPQVPADWARRPSESRVHLFARRIAWHAARDAAHSAGAPPPALTSDVDPEEVARRVASIESKLPR